MAMRSIPTCPPGDEWPRDLASALARVPLFAGLQRAELERLSVGLRRKCYRKGRVIVWQGDPGTTLFLIESGRAKVVVTSTRGQEAILNVLGPGDFFGDIAILDGGPRTADVIAVEDSRLLLLERNVLVSAIEENPGLGLKLLAALAGRLRRDVELLEEASFMSVAARLARVLLRLADVPDEVDTGVYSIPTRWTQAELAALVSASRETVNRCLGELENRGIIRREGGQIVIMKPDELSKGVD